MAKGLRSSVKKSNRTKLRSRVFEPVEAARRERLHAKLLETIQQPRPEPTKKNEMDVDSDGKIPIHRDKRISSNSPAANNTAQEANQEAEYPKGSCFLTAKIPASLSDNHSAIPTNHLDNKPLAEDSLENRNLFFYLGLCSDIVGFADSGDLEFAFDPLPSHWTSDQGLTVAT